VDPSYDYFACEIIIKINPVGNDGTMQFYNDKNEKIKSKNIIKYITRKQLFITNEITKKNVKSNIKINYLLKVYQHQFLN
jgi:hypothetical protein